jgi:hypothetical protein
MEEEKGQGEWPNEGPQSTDAEMHRLTESTVHRLTVTVSQTMTMSCVMRDGMKEGPGGRKGIVRGNLIFLYFLWEHRRSLTFFFFFLCFYFLAWALGRFFFLFFFSFGVGPWALGA